MRSSTCTPDPATAVAGTPIGAFTRVGPNGQNGPDGLNNLPSAAITTVGTNLGDGIVAGAALSPLFSLCVQGSVFSYTSITGSVKAGTSSTGSATACPDTASAATTVKSYGNAVAGHLDRAQLRARPLPGHTVHRIRHRLSGGPHRARRRSITSATTIQSATCLSTGSGSTTKVYAAFVPGVYTAATASNAFSLNAPCKISSKWVAANVDWFSPGVYYFNFGATSATTWTMPATVVGGTPAVAGTNGQTAIAGLSPTTASTLSNLSQMGTGEGKCVPPTSTAQTQPGAGGVEFVFGGVSTMTGATPPNILGVPTGPSTDFDICATYSASSPPVAIYGVQHALTVGTATIPVESGCVATSGCSLGLTTSLLNWPQLAAAQSSRPSTSTATSGRRSRTSRSPSASRTGRRSTGACSCAAST